MVQKRLSKTSSSCLQNWLFHWYHKPGSVTSQVMPMGIMVMLMLETCKPDQLATPRAGSSSHSVQLNFVYPFRALFNLILNIPSDGSFTLAPWGNNYPAFKMLFVRFSWNVPLLKFTPIAPYYIPVENAKESLLFLSGGFPLQLCTALFSHPHAVLTWPDTTQSWAWDNNEWGRRQLIVTDHSRTFCLPTSI